MIKDQMSIAHRRLCIFAIYLCLAPTTCFMHCDARKFAELLTAANHPKIAIAANVRLSIGMNMLKRFGIVTPVLDSSNSEPYGVSSPFSLPPYESLPPFPLPENAPPFSVYPPFTPQPPSLPNPPPSPSGMIPSPPQTNPIPNPPPTPPKYIPSPSTNFQSPPYSVPSPPSTYIPSPSIIVPSPPEFVPGAPIFLPPIVYPPPAVPPPPHTAPPMALWCVAKPSVPEPIIQEAMNYACASGADCDQIEPDESCFQPDTVLAHASYAFNSYWQRTKVAGGTCQFGGSAMLVTVDPSYDGCHFIYY